MSKRLDVKLGFNCNNHCTFCVQGNKRELYSPRKQEEIYRILEEGREKGAEDIVFTGGEPTVHKTLLESIRRAKALGYGRIQIQSNGRAFSLRNFTESLIEAGANEFSPSIHGARPETHDELVQVKGAFQQVLEGMKILREYDQYILTNTVITTSNYRELPALATLLAQLGVDQFQFAFIHILGTADNNKQWIVPRKTDIMPYVKKGLRIGKEHGMVAMTEAIPYCFMVGYEEFIGESYMPETTVYDAKYVTESYKEYRWNEGKVRCSDCTLCLYKDRCEGPWKEYPEIYGWEEFKPVLVTA